MPAATEAEVREREQTVKLAKVRSGVHQHKSDFPAFRLSGPIQQLIGTDGFIIHCTDRRHPCGPGKQWKSPPDDGEFKVPGSVQVGIFSWQKSRFKVICSMVAQATDAPTTL